MEQVTDQAREAARRELGRFLAALQFFIRLPLPEIIARHADHEAGLNRAATHFPLVGLAIGIAVAIVWAVAASLLPSIIAAGLALAAGMALTGGLHEDGLADCADGLGGGDTKEKALEIMRDSAIGTFGAAALIFSIGLRWAALTALSTSAGISALIIAHAVARGAIAIALRYATYARPEGTGKLVADGISSTELAIAVGISIAVGLLFGGMAGIAAGIIGFAAAALMLAIFRRRIGGYTGDALGAMEQMAEIAVLIALSGFWHG